MDTTLKWTMIGGIVVVSVSLAYYLLWFVPSKERVYQARLHDERIAKCIEDERAKTFPGMKLAIETMQGNYSAEEQAQATALLEQLTEQLDTAMGACRKYQQ